MTALWGSWAAQTLVAKGRAWRANLTGSWKLTPARTDGCHDFARDLVTEHVTPSGVGARIHGTHRDYDAEMSTEQIAGLAIVASSVVAIASALINALSTRNNTQQTLDAQAQITAQTLDTQTATTTLTLEHERQLAREARLWDRTADAYVQMLEMVAVFMVIVDETYPMLGDGGRGDPPSPPESNDVKALMARMAAYGSPETYAAVEAWWTTRLDFDHAAWELDTVRARSPGVDARDIFNLSEADQYAKLNDARAASHRSVRALQDEINEELRG